MFAGKWECGLRSVIERSSGPISGGMADRAIERESRSHMVRIGRALKVFQMA